MNWINAFELLCYAITLVFLIDIIRKKNRISIITARISISASGLSPISSRSSAA